MRQYRIVEKKTGKSVGVFPSPAKARERMRAEGHQSDLVILRLGSTRRRSKKRNKGVVRA